MAIKKVELNLGGNLTFESTFGAKCWWSRKESLNLIPLPSVKFKLLAGNFIWGIKAKHC